DATEFGVAACNAPAGPTISTAEQAIALIFATTKGLRESHNRLERQEGNYWGRHGHLELQDSTLTLIGIGRIGGRVASIAKAVGMDVVAHDPYKGDDRFAELGVRRAASAEEAVAQAHVVSVHAPLSDETRHLVDAELIGHMPDGVYIVNTARGGLVDDAALLSALDSGKVRAAGLDVTDPEPLPAGHPLLGRDDVVVTPHVASATTAGARRIFQIAIDTVLSTLAGERPEALLNPNVWPGRNA
ncbi:MAG: NAD(P)-dependent oxidoreductase, partial [Actinomycetota bacterium]|nr:NAD(P)-dependent oxidoreductase [Actinomycetota bacterium]